MSCVAVDCVDHIHAGKAKSELKMFPYISTLDANYSPELVGLLSQMSTWQMLQLQQQLGRLLMDTNAALTRVATDISSGSAAGASSPAGSGPSKSTSDGVVRLEKYGRMLGWLVIFAAGAWVLAA
jgi:hypothetical protein